MGQDVSPGVDTDTAAGAIAGIAVALESSTSTMALLLSTFDEKLHVGDRIIGGSLIHLSIDPGHDITAFIDRLVSALGEGIHKRAERAVLHVLAESVGAVRLYQRLGFVIRRRMTFLLLSAPE